MNISNTEEKILNESQAKQPSSNRVMFSQRAKHTRSDSALKKIHNIDTKARYMMGSKMGFRPRNLPHSNNKLMILNSNPNSIKNVVVGSLND